MEGSKTLCLVTQMWNASTKVVGGGRTLQGDLEKEMAAHSSVLPRESQGRGSLVGFRLWGRTESDTTE